MKKTRYIIADEDMGVFLGTYSGEDLGEIDEGKTYICFASNNPFGLTNSCSFQSESAAKYFIRTAFPPATRAGLKILPVESETDYPSAVEIVKAGHTDFTHDMIDCLFDERTINTIH